MQQQARRLWLILAVVTTGSVCVAWEITVSPVVAVSRGEDAILSCSFTPSSPNYSGKITVKWTAREKKGPPFFQCSVKNDSLEGPNPCSFPEVQYSLHGDPRRGDASLLIRSVQLTHNGSIFCGVEVEGRWLGLRYLQEKTELYVEVKPRILSLYVVNVSCNPDSSSSSAPSWLQCEVEGHPLPTVVWLSASRYKLDDQGQTWRSGESRKTSCVPYEEKQNQVVICRPESRLGHAERSFPSSDVLTIIQISCGLVPLVLLSASVLIYCLWRKRRQRVSNSPADGATELQPVYSELSCDSPVLMNSLLSRHHHHHHHQQEEQDSTVYSLVKVHSSETLQVS